MTSVVLVDDHPLLRQAVAAMIGSQAGLEVVAEAGTISEARTALKPLPDVLIVDVSLPDGSGMDLVREVRGRLPEIGIVVLTMHDDDDVVLAALDAGASGLVLKSAPSDGHRRRGPAGRRRPAQLPRRRARPRAACEPQQAGPAGPHPARERGPPAARRRPVRRGDRAPALPERVDRQDAHHEDLRQARRPQPRERRHGRDQGRTRQRPPVITRPWS